MNDERFMISFLPISVGKVVRLIGGETHEYLPTAHAQQVSRLKHVALRMVY